MGHPAGGIRERAHDALFRAVHRRCLILAGLHPWLPDFARRFWEAKENYFEASGMRQSFYYRGTAGAAAWILRRTILGTKKQITPRYSRVHPVMFGAWSYFSFVGAR